MSEDAVNNLKIANCVANSTECFDGFAADAISPERVARWADPAGGYFHAMQPALRGDFTWRIMGKDVQGGLTMEGGQNNRGGAVHQKIRFIENIFEELDAPQRVVPEHQNTCPLLLPASRLQEQSGRDEHSILADAQFVDPARGDYRVKEGSPALLLGFVNFPMDRFGVQKPSLKALARTAVLPGQAPVAASPARNITPRSWLEASVRNVADMGERSALGLPSVAGVLVLEVPADSALARSGLQKGDVILSVDGSQTADVGALLQQAWAVAHVQSMALIVSRQQKEITLNLKR